MCVGYRKKNLAIVYASARFNPHHLSRRARGWRARENSGCGGLYLTASYLCFDGIETGLCVREFDIGQPLVAGISALQNCLQVLPSGLHLNTLRIQLLGGAVILHPRHDPPVEQRLRLSLLPLSILKRGFSGSQCSAGAHHFRTGLPFGQAIGIKLRLELCRLRLPEPHLDFASVHHDQCVASLNPVSYPGPLLADDALKWSSHRSGGARDHRPHKR